MPARSPRRRTAHSAYGYARQYLGNRFVCVLFCPRTHGLLIEVNLSPDQRCSFNCVYCDVDRTTACPGLALDVDAVQRELADTLALAHEGRLRKLAPFHLVPRELLQLKEVALSGEGEPTLCPEFAEVAEAVITLRAQDVFPFFKLALITNGTGLHLPAVKRGLRWFTSADEIWVKLDAGTADYMRRINRAGVSLRRSLSNILKLARQRPVVIQSLFPVFARREPPAAEIEQYAQRLLELKEAGAQIALVQIYSAHRVAAHPECSHLPLQSLKSIAERVRAVTGLPTEVF